MNALKILVAAAVLSLALTATAEARTFVAVAVGVRPVPPRVERVVVAPGYAWISGYWRWNGARRVWVSGHRIVVRPGYRYARAAYRVR